MKRTVALQQMIAVVPFAKFADEAALQDINDVAVFPQQRPQLAQMLQVVAAVGLGQVGDNSYAKRNSALALLSRSFRKNLDVVQFASWQVLAVAVAHQEAVALHDGNAVIAEEIEFILPLGMAGSMPSGGCRGSGGARRNVDVLKNRLF